MSQPPRGDADDPGFRCRQTEFNQVSSSFVEAGEDVVTGTAACEKTPDGKSDPDSFTVHGQDLVEQVRTLRVTPFRPSLREITAEPTNGVLILCGNCPGSSSPGLGSGSRVSALPTVLAACWSTLMTPVVPNSSLPPERRASLHHRVLIGAND